MLRSLTLLAGLMGLAPVAARPTLVFSAAELPTLRQRVQREPYANLWAVLLGEADKLIDPASPDYADPAAIDSGGHERIVIRAHTYGRRLIDWMERLGFAYQITGDERYARHAAAILTAAAERMPIGDDRIAGSFAGARGDIMSGLALGLDWCGDALTADERATVEAMAADYVRNLLAEAHGERAWWVPHHNFIGVAVGAAGCLAILLEDAYPNEAPGWRADCVELIETWLSQGFDADGAYVEGVGYANYGLSNGILFLDALVNNGGPDLFGHPHLRQVPRFYAQSKLPGEAVFENRNDSGYANTAPSMLRLAEGLAPHDPAAAGLARWLWDETGSGPLPFRIAWANEVAPLDPPAAGLGLADHFEGRGLVVFRTGWQADDVMFSTEAGPFFPVTHNQADKGHFNLYGLGGRWAIDSGYGNDRAPESRAQAPAHNVIFIDGKSQAISGAGSGTDGRIVAVQDTDRFGSVLVDAADAYNRSNKGPGERPVERALRHAAFIRPADGLPAYVVQIDDIVADDQPHDYTWLWHTDDRNSIELRDDGFVLRPVGTSGGRYVETPIDATERGRCAWRVPVPAAGSYTLWARVRATGDQPSKTDSFVVEAPGRPAVQWHMPGSLTWAWAKVTEGVGHEPVTFDLPAGEQTLAFSTREPGAQVDCLALTAGPAAAPPFAGLDPALKWEAESGEITAPMVAATESAPEPAALRLVLDAVAPIAWTPDSYDGHPRLNATTRAVAPGFVAVMLPLPPGTAEPRVTVERGEATTVRVAWPQRTDTIVWPAEPGAAPEVTIG